MPYSLHFVLQHLNDSMKGGTASTGKMKVMKFGSINQSNKQTDLGSIAPYVSQANQRRDTSQMSIKFGCDKIYKCSNIYESHIYTYIHNSCLEWPNVYKNC